jgi:hypothetical protein
MPRVEVLTEVSRCDPEVVLIEHLPSEIPADEPNADQLAEHTVSALEDADPKSKRFPPATAARPRPLPSARCAVRPRAAPATGAPRPAAARPTARRASSPSSSSTRGAPLVTSLRA